MMHLRIMLAHTGHPCWRPFTGRGA